MGLINSIFTGSALDGPGVRSVVFFQGCPLRCAYCHNPETRSIDGGEEISASLLYEKISRYAVYYGKKGGVTFSGGDPLMQPEFLLEMLNLCKQGGIHTAVDTSGFSGGDTNHEIIKLADLFLLDIKMNCEQDYKEYIGTSLKKVLDFLELCEKYSTDVWIRQVIVPEINDSDRQIHMLADLLKGKECIKKIQLLPFEKLCITKYNDLGIPFPLENTPTMDKDKLDRLQERIVRLMVE